MKYSKWKSAKITSAQLSGFSQNEHIHVLRSQLKKENRTGSPFMFLPVTTSLNSKCINFQQDRLALSIFELYRNGIIPSVLFCVWLLSYNMRVHSAKNYISQAPLQQGRVMWLVLANGLWGRVLPAGITGKNLVCLPHTLPMPSVKTPEGVYWAW